MIFNLKQTILLALTIAFVFILVFSIHVNYPYPYHIDEWHSISESIRLSNWGEYLNNFKTGAEAGLPSVEIGFHFVLLILSWFTNLILVYKFLPALWAILGAASLFYIIYKKTNKNFLIAWLSVIFFASLKSNVNILGLWFFTPLTFVIPLIFLYIYFFTEGIARENKKYLLYSIGIMTVIIPTHSISVLFIIPALIVYLLIYYKYVIREYKFFLSFLIIPIIGLIFFKTVSHSSWLEVVPKLFEQLQFKFGWGVLELNNLFTEVYSPLGYLLAGIGVISIVINNNIKKYAIFLLWPLSIFILIIIYRITGISYLSPYQRNLYYFAISLPALSAFGLYYIISIISAQVEKFNLKLDIKQYLKIAITIILISVTLLGIFKSYNDIDKQIQLYKVINKNNYKTLLFLKDYKKGGRKVLANPFISTAIYPISGHKPVSTIFFRSEDRSYVEDFFLSNNCKIKSELIVKLRARYVIVQDKIDCGWELIYNKDNNLIYDVKWKEIQADN